MRRSSAVEWLKRFQCCESGRPEECRLLPQVELGDPRERDDDARKRCEKIALLTFISKRYSQHE
jgi:hypothetical protein